MLHKIYKSFSCGFKDDDAESELNSLYPLIHLLRFEANTELV